MKRRKGKKTEQLKRGRKGNKAQNKYMRSVDSQIIGGDLVNFGSTSEPINNEIQNYSREIQKYRSRIVAEVIRLKVMSVADRDWMNVVKTLLAWGHELNIKHAGFAIADMFLGADDALTAILMNQLVKQYKNSLS